MLDVDARHHDLLFLLGLAPLALGCAVGAPNDGPQFTSAAPSPNDGDGAAEDPTSADEGGTDDGTTGGADGMSASVSVSVSVSVSAGDDTTSGADSASASVSVSASASASMSAGDSYGDSAYGTSYGDDYSSGLPPPGDPCEGYAYVIADCYYGGDPDAVQFYQQNCEMVIAQFGMMYGPACAAAFEETRACISQLSCQELMMYGTGTCVAEQNAFEASCS